MELLFSRRQRVWLALTISSLVGVGLCAVGMLRNYSFDFWYLPTNLALGLIPLLLAVWLRYVLKTHKWNSWLPLVLTFLWILFLPNSFYIVSDFIHLAETPRVDITQDIVMLAQFSFTGMAFGFIGMFMVHREFIKRAGERWAGVVAALLLFLCSFAIYLGRDLRWNSWDIVTQPVALLADISRHIFNPFAYPEAFIITWSFFISLGSVYFVLWQIGKAAINTSYNKKI
jgi:uncharacterized membrane protein